MGDAEARRRLVVSHRGVPTYINLKIKSPLRMKDGDVIDAFSVQPRNQLTARPAKINVVVNGQFSGDAHIVHFRIKKSTQLNRLMTAYCDRRSLHINCCVFLWTGRRLRPDQTPDELEMEDGEEIYVMANFPLCENCRRLD